jgi:hypothetical protein
MIWLLVPLPDGMLSLLRAGVTPRKLLLEMNFADRIYVRFVVPGWIIICRQLLQILLVAGAADPRFPVRIVKLFK